MYPVTIKEHRRNVGQLRCVVSGRPDPTLHHCKGGSLADAGYHSGMAQRGVSEALIIPLDARYHTGPDGIDYGVGVRSWEERFGAQMDHLEDVGEQLGYDLFQLHRLWEEEPPKRG